MRILVVEDDRAVSAQIASELARAGYLADTVFDGEEAWFKGDTEDYAAAILDLGLPGLDGISIVKRWRQAGIKTPVVMLTARSTWMERVAGIDAGADDYLPKPFQGEELVARLGAVLRRAGGHSDTVLSAGELAIDTRRMMVTLSEKSVAVTALEFRLLRYLLHHCGRVVPASELYDHIYAGGNSSGSNALEVLVNRVRKKLDGNVIGTRRGLGYIIEA